MKQAQISTAVVKILLDTNVNDEPAGSRQNIRRGLKLIPDLSPGPDPIKKISANIYGKLKF